MSKVIAFIIVIAVVRHFTNRKIDGMRRKEWWK